MASNQPPEQDLSSAPSNLCSAADEQLLAGLRHLSGHELPNQLIAMQGLLQVFQADEADRVTPAGRDLLERASSLARQVHETVHRMAELCRLRYQSEAPDDVSLLELTREAAAEISQLSPQRTITYDLPDREVRLKIPRLLLRRALVQLVKWVLAADPGAHSFRIQFHANDVSEGAELRVVIREVRLGGEALLPLRQVLVEQAPAASAIQLDLFFVRQVVERGGGSIAVEGEGDQGVSVSMRWPTRK
jgi:signal transduction histidine kinase